MAHFLTDSEEDDRSTVSSEGSENASGYDSDGSEEPGFWKWRKRSVEASEDESDDMNRASMSKKEKALAEIDNMCDTFDFYIDSSWAQCNSNFDKVMIKVNDWLKRDPMRPRPYLQSLVHLVEVVEDRKNSLSKDDMDYTEYKQFTMFAKKVTDQAQECETELKRLSEQDDGEDAGEDDEGRKGKVEDWSESGMIDMLAAMAQRTKGRTALCERIVRTAEEASLKHVVVSAAAQVALYALAEDPNPNYVSTKSWRRAHDALIVSIRTAIDANIVVTENDTNITSKRSFVPTGFHSIVVRLKEEITRACQFIELATTEYMQRIRDEGAVAHLLDEVLDYYMKKGSKRPTVRCASALLDVIAVRTPQAHATYFTQFAAQGDRKPTIVTAELSESVAAIYDIVLANSPDSETEARATLQLVYNLALHNDFHAARDTMLRNRMQDTVSSTTFKAGESFRVLYNRVVAQLALCAFRVGQHNETASLLSELCARSSREVRELIGQRDMTRLNLPGYDEKRELEDRSRLVPPHHHIPGPLLDLVYMTVSMLTDALNEARMPFDNQNRNKAFMTLTRRNSSLAVNGAPSDDLDWVFHIYQGIVKGDVASALTALNNINAWNLLGSQKNDVLALLTERVKVDALKVFLINYGASYSALTVAHLQTKFDLPANKIHSIVSRLLLDHTLTGYWDQTEECVTIERGTQSRIHHLARESADRIAQFATYNDSAANAMLSQRADGRGGRGLLWGGAPRGRGGRGRGGN